MSDQPSLDELRERWAKRIQADFDAMGAAMIRLREIAAQQNDPKLNAALDELHRSICAAANTDTFRLLLNGYISEITRGCDGDG